MSEKLLEQLTRLDEHFGGAIDTREIIGVSVGVRKNIYRADSNISPKTVVDLVTTLIDAIICRDPFNFLIDVEKEYLMIPLLKYIKANADKLK